MFTKSVKAIFCNALKNINLCVAKQSAQRDAFTMGGGEKPGATRVPERRSNFTEPQAISIRFDYSGTRSRLQLLAAKTIVSLECIEINSDECAQCGCPGLRRSSRL